MDKEYSIDDILSEVKKRREENEQSVKKEDSIRSSHTVERKEEKPQAEIKAQPVSEKKPKPVEKKVQETIKAVKTEKANEPKEDKPEKKKPASDTQDIPVASKKEEAEQENMIDLLSFSAQPEEPVLTEKEEKVRFRDTKKGKIIISIIVVLLALIIAAGGIGIYYVNNVLNKIKDDDGQSYEKTTYYDGMDFLQEDFPTIDEVSASEIYNYKEYLKQWYKNGDPVSSTHVLNILLIGEDTREEKISDTSRADSAIIASINIDTGKITLTSILRDLYVYFEIDGQEYYDKINGAASRGGMKAYINTVERYYKIAIDNYAVVNFASFPKIIDALGGVDIALTRAEVYEVNSHNKRYAGAKLPEAEFDENGEPKKVKLDGTQALAYCRIRKIDSDNARADRQKTVLNALFKKMKKTGKLDAVKVVNELADYVKTGYKKKELIAIGNTALKDGWLNYKVKTTNIPRPENCAGGQKFSVAYGSWIWLADIPKDAYELQMKIYGKSNINLNENRPDYISLGR